MKKMMNRILLLALAACLLLVTACSSDDDDDAYDDVTEEESWTEYPSDEEEEMEAPDDSWGGEWEESGESYLDIRENTSTLTEEESMVSLSLKVDTSSYSNVTRYIQSGSYPPADAVKVEEMINYFRYDTDMEFGDEPFALYTEVGPSPFDENKQMAYIRVKTEDIDPEDLPSSNITLLIDTSGSMSAYDKMPLLKSSLGLLVENLDGNDMVSIVTYAGSSEVVLDSVPGDDHDTIMAAINGLTTGGSTAGADGINTAYALAEKNFMDGGNNRIILASDGDFNVGPYSLDELEALIAEKRDSGVYLSVLGFGTGNIRDDIMETLAANGNGNYSYIDSTATAKKVLVEELAANLFVVADDVKAQVEFNPANVKSYRLIGYENRRMTNEEFDDDATDAGEVGAGTDVVILFEIELYGSGGSTGQKYSQAEPESERVELDYADELFEVRVRYKAPGGGESLELVQPVTYGSITDEGSTDFTFACAVAAFGHILRDSQYVGSATVDAVYEMAEASLGLDDGGYRWAFLELLQQYMRI